MGELYFLDADGRMIAVEVRPGSGFAHGEPQALFATRLFEMSNFNRRYVASPDGQRFLMNVSLDQGGSPITVVLN